MGAWGTGNFDNDTALDWVFELEDINNLSLIEKTVNTAIEENYIDSDIGVEVLVAIEAIARLNGNFGKHDPYSEDLDNWVKNHDLEVSESLKDKAKKVLDRILTNKSELFELWKESDELEAWRRVVLDLQSRLD